MLYEITATVDGVDNTLIVSTRSPLAWLAAKEWASEQGYANIVMHKFTDL